MSERFLVRLTRPTPTCIGYCAVGSSSTGRTVIAKPFSPTMPVAETPRHRSRPRSYYLRWPRSPRRHRRRPLCPRRPRSRWPCLSAWPSSAPSIHRSEPTTRGGCWAKFEEEAPLPRHRRGERASAGTVPALVCGDCVLGVDQANFRAPRAPTKHMPFDKLIRPALHVQGAWYEGFAYHFVVANV